MTYIDKKGHAINDEVAELQDVEELRRVYRNLNPLPQGQKPSKKYLENENQFVLVGLEELIKRDGIGN